MKTTYSTDLSDAEWACLEPHLPASKANGRPRVYPLREILDGESLSLIDGEGRTFKTDPDTFGYVPQELDPFLTQVNPGVTQAGRVIFTVAPGASGFQLKLGDAAFFSAEEGFVNLGF